MCYTSGTTGNPKGVVYSHRVDWCCTRWARRCRTSLNIRERDVIMPVVPMFHVNAWGLPFTADDGRRDAGAARRGASTRRPDPPDRDREGHAGGRRADGLAGRAGRAGAAGQHDISSVSGSSCGGSAAPRAMMERYEKQYGVPDPARLGHDRDDAARDRSRASRATSGPAGGGALARTCATQGLPVAAASTSRRVDEDGDVVPWDGKALGELEVRGPWVTSGYYNDPSAGRSLHRGRLVPDRRRRHDRPGGLLPDRRPHQGPGQERRRVDLHASSWRT